jgi:peroxiredoxin
MRMYLAVRFALFSLIVCVVCIVPIAIPAQAAMTANTGAAAGAAAGIDFTSPPVGRPAPPFLLSTVAGGSPVASDTLFDVSAVTLLAFWTTHCSECIHRLEACQTLYDWGAGDGLNVIGVNFDEQPSSKIQVLSRNATPRLLQLYDAGGRIAAEYGAGAHSFSVYLIDETGTIRATGYELSPDSLTALKPRLARLLAIPSPVVPERPRETGLLEEFGLIKQQRFSVAGVGRVRWMNIDTTGVGATGGNGEAIAPGTDFHHRLELQFLYQVTPKLTAGGLLWLSNEGEAVLRSGPDYLSSPWGSAFVRYDTRVNGNALIPGLGPIETSLRAGYYDAFFTPLTLMRWDKDDSPISGGQKLQGCGVCGGEAGMAGFMRSESLEKLAPQYMFEGARWDASLAGWIDLTALYARPQEHWPQDVGECALTPAKLMRYRQNLYAGRVTGLVTLPWAPDLLRIAATGVLVEEETDGWACGGTVPTYTPGRDRVLGADLWVPLPARTELAIEFAQSRWQNESSDDDGGGTAEADTAVDAQAVRADLKTNLRFFGDRQRAALASGPGGAFSGGLGLRGDMGYQRVGEDFYSPYSALSYESNIRLREDSTLPGLKGPRASLRLEWGAFGLGGFVKSLDPVKPDAAVSSEVGVPTGKHRLASLWIDALIWEGGTLMGGWVRDDRDPLAAQGALSEPVPREERRTTVVSFEQELAPRCLLMIEAQFLKGRREDAAAGAGDALINEYTTRTLRAMIDVEF